MPIIIAIMCIATLVRFIIYPYWTIELPDISHAVKAIVSPEETYVKEHQ